MTVISKLIEGMIEDRKAGRTLLEKVDETLEDGWVTVGPRSHPLESKDTGNALVH